MKKFFWSNGALLILGCPKLERGKTIYDSVPDLMDVMDLVDLESKFAEKAPAAKAKAASKEKKKDEKKAEEIHLEQAPADDLRNQNVAKRLMSPEGTDRTFTVEEAVQAFVTMDDSIIDMETLGMIKKTLILEEDRMMQLQALKTAHPSRPLGLAEQFMVAFGAIPRAEEAARFWMNAEALVESFRSHEKSLRKFEKMVDSLYSSTVLKEFLAIMLACGNYVNMDNGISGKASSRQDGMELDFAMLKFGEFKDVTGWPMTRFAIDALCKHNFETFEWFVEKDLADCFSCVRRSAQESKITKEPAFDEEEIEKAIEGLEKKYESDAAKVVKFAKELPEDDPIRLRLPALFEKAGNEKAHVREMFDAVVSRKFKELKEYLLCDPKCTANKFMLLWDDFFCHPDILVKVMGDPNRKDWKPWLEPRGRYEVSEILSLWGLSDGLYRDEANRIATKKKIQEQQRFLSEQDAIEKGKRRNLCTGVNEQTGGVGKAGKGKADGKGGMNGKDGEDPEEGSRGDDGGKHGGKGKGKGA